MRSIPESAGNSVDKDLVTLLIPVDVDKAELLNYEDVVIGIMCGSRRGNDWTMTGLEIRVT